MLYYSDENFTTLATTYEIHDKAFVKVTVDTPPSISETLKGIEIVNTWLCTASDNLSLHQISGNGGCPSSSLVDAHDDWPMKIISNGEPAFGESIYNPQVYIHSSENGGNIDENEAGFSFIVPGTVMREALFTHVQVELPPPLISSPGIFAGETFS